MNFVVSSTTLLKHLQTISGVLTTNNTLPILDNFLFEIKDNQLQVAASDIETTMKTSLEVEANDTGNICIPAKLLLDILKNLPDQPLTFTVDMSTFGIEIAYSNGKSKMVGYDGGEYPRVKELQETGSSTLQENILLTAINKTIFATGNDDLRPTMNGVFFEMTESSMTFVATDGHKLVRYRRTDAKTDKEASFIAPKKALNLLKNSLSKEEGEVAIHFNESNAVFTYQNIELTCRLIEGKYPNYEAVIPQESPNILTIDREVFLNSIRRVSIFANKTTHQIQFNISGAELTVSAEDTDFANEAKERLTCKYDGEDIEIGFNSRVILEMLGSLSSAEVQLKMSQPNRAGVLIPATSNEEGESVLMLAMPIMTNS